MNHASNLWDVVHGGGERVVIVSPPQPGQLIEREAAINLAVWLLRAAGATNSELNDAMFEAIDGAPRRRRW